MCLFLYKYMNEVPTSLIEFTVILYILNPLFAVCVHEERRGEHHQDASLLLQTEESPDWNGTDHIYWCTDSHQTADVSDSIMNVQ